MDQLLFKGFGYLKNYKLIFHGAFVSANKINIIYLTNLAFSRLFFNNIDLA